MNLLDEKSWIALLAVRRHSFLPTIPLYTFRWLLQWQHELYHEVPAHILELFFRRRLVASARRVCLVLANKHVAQPTHAYCCERWPPL